MLIHELTSKYGPVIREGKVTCVLESAFDVVIVSYLLPSEAAQILADIPSPNSVLRREYMPIRCRSTMLFMMSTVTNYRELCPFHTGRPSSRPRLYWTQQDILPFLIETSDDPSILSISRQALSISNSSPKPETNGLAGQSKQYAKSANRSTPAYQGLRSTGNAQHRIQDVRELMTIPVVVMADMTKSPPVLMIYACNP